VVRLRADALVGRAGRQRRGAREEQAQHQQVHARGQARQRRRQEGRQLGRLRAPAGCGRPSAASARAHQAGSARARGRPHWRTRSAGGTQAGPHPQVRRKGARGRAGVRGPGRGEAARRAAAAQQRGPGEERRAGDRQRARAQREDQRRGVQQRQRGHRRPQRHPLALVAPGAHLQPQCCPSASSPSGATVTGMPARAAATNTSSEQARRQL